jgi:ketosteroid isomerase-like protein
MSQENVEVVRGGYELLLRNLADSEPGEAELSRLCDPEIHLDQTRRVLNPASYDGYEGLLRAIAEVRDAWELFEVQPDRFIDAGDRVVVLETVRGRGRGSGVEIMDSSASVYTLRDGRLLRVVVYRDQAEALEAVGLPG